MDNYKLKYLKYKNKYLKLKNELDMEQNGGRCMNNKYNTYDLSKQLGGSSGEDELMLFKAEWCGHCQNFKSEWENLKNDKYLKSKYRFTTYDSDENKEKMEEYKIKGFPTLYVRKNNQNYEYQGPMSKMGIELFINSL